MQTDKEILKKRFSKKVCSYHQEAVTQKKISEKLSEIVMGFHSEKIHTALEIGCGSGFLTQAIISQSKIDKLYLNDLSEDSLSETEKAIKALNFTNYQLLPGDAESIDFPKVNSILSSSCFHWFHDLEAFFKKAHQSLETGGILAFSSYGEDNFKEIKETLGIGLTYNNLEEHIKLLSADFEILYSKEWKEVASFCSPIEVLKHMQETGVNSLQKNLFGKEKMLAFSEKYQEKFSNKDNSVNFTYHPLIIIAKKK